jgi:integrase/recombinase XerD
MLNQVFDRPFVLSRLRAGPFGDLLDEYAGRLRAQGYTRSTIRQRVWAVEHFGTWFHSHPRSSPPLDQEAVRRFLVEHLPHCRCPAPAPLTFHSVRPALTQLLRLLRDRGRLRPEAVASQPAVVAVEQFRHHLRETCGLAESTCRGRVRYALAFLEGKFGHGPLRWGDLHPSDAVSFVTGYAQRCRPGATQMVADALRSFLRYLQFRGWCSPALVAAVPRFPHWRLSHLPKTMTDEQLGAFLATFDQATATGRRDYAMALCQAHLGLRVSEVVDLLLEDLNWRAATLHVANRKTGRARELPLPQCVGQAIADYLRQGRPTTADRHVFVRHRRLQGVAVSASLVRNVMALAFDRVPGCEHWAGTHVLRHTAATRLHRRGANFKEIADLLGHRCLSTTAIYAKVDLPSLSGVALPWPEAQK